MLWSLYYCLFAPHIYGVVLRAHPVRGEPRIQRNASVEVATLPRITLPDHLWYVYEVTEIFEAWASTARAYARGFLGLAPPPLSLIFYKNVIVRECIGFDFYKNKGSECRRICQLCQQTSLENINMTSNCDVTKSAHQIQMTIICHWMKPPPRKFSAYATVPQTRILGKNTVTLRPVTGGRPHCTPALFPIPFH